MVQAHTAIPYNPAPTHDLPPNLRHPDTKRPPKANAFNDLVAGVAGVTGLEPAASGVTGRRSNQLSYTPQIEKGAIGTAPFTWDLSNTATKQDCQALSKKRY